MTAPWPLKPLGDVVEQVRFIVFTFEMEDGRHEVVNSPRDPGGRTLSGLTMKTYSRDYLRLPAPELAPVSQFDALSLDDVVAIICELFAMRTAIWRIPDPALRLAVLDMAIHGGPSDAIRALQRSLGATVDGLIGPDTEQRLAALAGARATTAAVMDERYQKAGRVVVARPSQAGFLNGWLHRFGRVLRLTAAVAAVLTCVAGAAQAQDGGETPNGQPRSSVGRVVPVPVGTSGPRYWSVPLAQLSTTTHTHACVLGTVALRKTEADGDVHLRIEDGHAFIVAEIIPELPRPAPSVGDRVEVCGITRDDRAHRWPELHPVIRIRVLKSSERHVGTAGTVARIAFIHPRTAVVLAGLRGTDVPVQTRIPADARNRIWLLEWDGDGCSFGSSARSLDGENAPAIQPETLGQKLYTVRVGGQGICTFVAETRDGSGRPVSRGRFDLEVR